MPRRIHVDVTAAAGHVPALPPWICGWRLELLDRVIPGLVCNILAAALAQPSGAQLWFDQHDELVAAALLLEGSVLVWAIRHQTEPLPPD